MPGREEALERARAAAAKSRSELREVDGRLTSPYPTPKRRGYQGPASDLPTENPPELYSSAFSVPSGDRSELPFGREFDFSDEGSRELPRGYTPGDTSTIAERSRRFIDQYFGGVDSEVVNPATGRLYGKELKVHDALHDYANLGNMLGEEELLTPGESIATSPLAAENVNLTGLTQQDLTGSMSSSSNPADLANFQERKQRNNTRMSGRTLVQQRGATRGSSLFRDMNNPASFLSPPITEGEFDEVTRRAREFYDQVHAGWMRSTAKSQADTVPIPSERAGVRPLFRSQRARQNWEDAARRADYAEASKAFIEGDAFDYGDNLQNLQIEGGYRDPGGMPFGSKERLMNPPLVPVGDANEYDKSLRRQIEPIAKRWAGVAMADYERLSTPEQAELRAQEYSWKDQAADMRTKWYDNRELYPLQNDDRFDWVGMDEGDLTSVGLLAPEGNRTTSTASKVDPTQQAYARSLIEQDVRKGIWPLEDQHNRAAKAALGEPPQPLRADPRVERYLFPSNSRLRYETLRKRPSLVKPDLDLWKNIAMESESRMDDMRGLRQGGITSAAPFGKVSEASPGGQIFLNPPNLGSNEISRRTGPLQDRIAADDFRPAKIGNKEAEQILLNAAVDSKDKFRVTNAIRTGFGAAADTIGSVPFLDPGFRAAVENKRPGDAAKVLATDLVAGAVATPVVGAAAGVLQRAAPRVAARALPAAAAVSRVGNPVAVVSQLGGDRQLTRAQEVADRQAAEAQRNRARLAQQRGGRISFPTPFGKVRLPDFGASESGGLFLGGNSSGRRIGARSVLGGKPVVWTGDSYGWQSPGSAAKVGAR